MITLTRTPPMIVGAVAMTGSVIAAGTISNNGRPNTLASSGGPFSFWGWLG